MSKKYTLILFVFLCLFTINTISIKAQSTYEQAYQNYISQMDKYRAAREEYQLKRVAYLRHGTLTAQREAEVATKNFLSARDEVWITYIAAVIAKLNITSGIDETQRGEINTKLEEERNWYVDHKQRVESENNLDNLVSLSDEAKTRSDTTQEVGFLALHTISFGKIDSNREDASNLIIQLENKIAGIESAGNKDTTIIKKWLGDAKNQLAQTQGNEELARKEIDKMKDPRSGTKKTTYFNTSQNFLSQARTNVLEAMRFMREIIIEIKTADNGR